MRDYSMKNKMFQVIGVSSNANSFGLHGIMLVAKDGTAIEAGCSIHGGGQPNEIRAGHHVALPLVNDGIEDIVACLNWQDARLVETNERISFEIPTLRHPCPKALVKKFWKTPAMEDTTND